MRIDLRFDSIQAFHDFSNLPKTEHPLISLIDYSVVKYPPEYTDMRWVQNYYSIGLKRNVSKKFNYGQLPYDFDEGVLTLVAPQQVIHIEIDPDAESDPSGWLLLIHPDFFWNTSLAKKIKRYEFFGYAVNEALFLSDKEEQLLIAIFRQIRKEYQSHIDKFTHDIIIGHLELLLRYTERFYQRQFLTRRKSNHQILEQMESVLDSYFEDDSLALKGIPPVTQIAESLHLTPNYLSTLLKMLTGLSTQQHLQSRLIAKAKEKLSTTNLSVSEIAYTLGFGHPASFNKFFKSKTQMSPGEFRSTFN
ncbi:helix-turn-helix transcriptional regulator [Olivibacter sp. SDN3]|uniref:helix-turn-helix domain-containing protein n=1 Tax=Olivibacter sp. SDN3 TaxID=2764720 RepID=UPI00165123C7|nr:response regulator transcription factor [Olivibacter sp. SDN3]QNL48109.1 helix-turn-helix transcriptional regulator [Olivibacter sp. SDN3]